jgi:hypothetical protein
VRIEVVRNGKREAVDVKLAAIPPQPAPDSKRRAQPHLCLTAAIGIQVRRNADVSLTTCDRCALKLRRIHFNVTSTAPLSGTHEAMIE